MSSSCSALCLRMKRWRSRFNCSVSSSGASLSSETSGLSSPETSPSDSDEAPSASGVSGVSSVPVNPFWLSPRLTHFAISASRRARLSASFRSTSSSSSTGAIPMFPSSSLSSPLAAISSRQALRRTGGTSRTTAVREGVLPSTASSTTGDACCGGGGGAPSAPPRRWLLERAARLRARGSSGSRCFFSFFSFLPLGRFSAGAAWGAATAGDGAGALGVLRLLEAPRSRRARFASPYPYPDITRVPASSALALRITQGSSAQAYLPSSIQVHLLPRV
mmetsp:Transcript_80003/g.226495  ORF Transcript_80003/g.226495 Transcript_80003/m.226495 type:complete len:277 (+) Transcript_80003:1288-2118(+)